MKHLILLASILSLAVAPACESDNGSTSDTGGSGSGSDGPSTSTGLDGDLALSELTDEQQMAACEASYESFTQWEADNGDMVARAKCYIEVGMALIFSPEEDCQELYDACLAAEADEVPEEVSCADQILDFSECTDVTVSEFEACNQAQYEDGLAFTQVLASGTCENIVEGTVPEGYDNVSPEGPPECVKIKEKCPALDDDADGEALCADVDCDMVGPYCDGDKIVVVFGALCNPSTGECEGGGTTGQECPDGCADGECVGGPEQPIDDEDEDPPSPPEPSPSAPSTD